MSRRNDAISLRQMREHAQEAIDLVRTKQRDDLNNDRLLELALVRLVEIVGEAANRVSEPGKKRFPQIPWPHIVGMRNRLIHAYDAVDLDILWDTVQHDLPALLQTIGDISSA